jgi:phage terminase large subunit-like protein
MDSDNWLLTYYQQIQDGTATVGKWIRLLYEKIIQDLEDKVYFYDHKKATRAIRFIEGFCHHSKGKLRPQLVKLELWQKALISAIFGLVNEDGLRQYREVFVLMGRKCGKSLLASGIAEYMVYADGEPGADTYFVAPKLDQADIVWGCFSQSVQLEPDLDKLTRKRKNDLYVAASNTQIKKIPFAEKTSDGFNPHMAVCDEIAAWAGEAGLRQYEVITSALGAREQPLVLSITTANYVSEGIYDDLYKRSTRFLLGNSREARLLPFLYQIDDLGKWDDINELRKSLPNLGVSVSVNFILEEIAKAEVSLSQKAEFLTKYCDIKQNASTAWLSSRDIGKSFPPNNFMLEDFRDCYALGGIDLSMTTDLTAAVVLIERGGIIYYFTRFFLPREKLEEASSRDALPYDIYVKRGLLTLSGDSVVDYHDVYNWFVELIEKYRIYCLQIGYDRYTAQYLVQDMETYGFHMEKVSQGSNLTGIINDTEGLIKEGRLQCGDDNDLMKAHWLDAALKIEDETNRRRLIKISKNAHVDGVAALLDAMCMRHNHWEELQGQLRNED